MVTGLHTEQYRAFSRALASARQAAGLSQRDLARLMDVDQSFIAKYERGRRRLDVVEFMQIIHAIGCDFGPILEPLKLQISNDAADPQ